MWHSANQLHSNVKDTGRETIEGSMQENSGVLRYPASGILTAMRTRYKISQKYLHGLSLCFRHNHRYGHPFDVTALRMGETDRLRVFPRMVKSSNSVAFGDNGSSTIRAGCAVLIDPKQFLVVHVAVLLGILTVQRGKTEPSAVHGPVMAGVVAIWISLPVLKRSFNSDDSFPCLRSTCFS